MKAMILAAGRGERMRPLTDSCPKPLLEVAGQPLIVHHIRRLKRAGIEELVINTSWLAEALEQALGDGASLGVGIHYSREAEALETAGGIRQALPLLGDEPFLLVNGDVWIDAELTSLVQRGLATDELAHLLLVPNPDHNPAGDFVLESGGRVREKRRDDEPALTFAGISLIHPGLIADFPFPQARLALREPLRRAMASGRVGGTRFDGQWVDIGTPRRLAELDRQLRQAD